MLEVHDQLISLPKDHRPKLQDRDVELSRACMTLPALAHISNIHVSKILHWNSCIIAIVDY